MTLNYRVDGAGDRMLVLSGSLGSTLAMWETLANELVRTRRVMRYDHPGHGGSPLADEATVDAFAGAVVRLLDEVGVERVDFCGLSLGGAVGMRLALDAPERIERLVLACTSARFATPQFWDERAELVRERGVEAIADVILERWFTPEFRDVRRYREMLVSTPAEGYARCCEALRDWDIRGALGAIEAETLAVAGADDPATPPSDLHAIANEIRGCRVTVIGRARHLANVERADEFNDAVRAHLDR